MTRRLAHGEALRSEAGDDAFLSDEERGYVRGFAHARRVEEFLAGRLAARRAIAALLGTERALRIVRERDGAPRIEGLPAGVTLALSISHGARRAIAVVAEGTAPLGVDLTDWTDAPRIRRVARRAFPRPDERARALVDGRTACRAWAIKEAVGKALRIGLLYDGGFERIEWLGDAVRVDGVASELQLRIVDADDGPVASAIGA